MREENRLSNSKESAGFGTHEEVVSERGDWGRNSLSAACQRGEGACRRR